MVRWHVATTMPFCELQGERNLIARGFQVFNPKCLVRRVVRNRIEQIIKPYIPGYLFINFDADDEERRWVGIVHTPGMKDILYASPQRPAVVRDAAMNVLLDRCNGGDIVAAENIDTALSRIIPIGSTVRVPALDQNGRVTWASTDRVRVLLSLLGTEREVTMKASAVELMAAS